MKRHAGALFGGVIVANLGLLLVLFFGRNAVHPVAPLAYAGAALAVGGAIVIVRSIVARRRACAPPTEAA